MRTIARLNLFQPSRSGDPAEMQRLGARPAQIDSRRFSRSLITCIVCMTCGCFTARDVMPAREFPITHMTGEDCKADKAQACYDEGLALTAAGSSAADRTRGIALMRRACGGKISAACGTLAERFKQPQKLSGQTPRYTREAVWDGVTGRVTLKCLLTTEGILKDCGVVAPRTEKEREILQSSRQAEEFLKTLSTWRFTPAQFDGQPCEIEYIHRIQMTLR